MNCRQGFPNTLRYTPSHCSQHKLLVTSELVWTSQRRELRAHNGRLKVKKIHSTCVLARMQDQAANAQTEQHSGNVDHLQWGSTPHNVNVSGTWQVPSHTASRWLQNATLLAHIVHTDYCLAYAAACVEIDRKVQVIHLLWVS